MPRQHPSRDARQDRVAPSSAFPAESDHRRRLRPLAPAPACGAPGPTPGLEPRSSLSSASTLPRRCTVAPYVVAKTRLRLLAPRALSRQATSWTPFGRVSVHLAWAGLHLESWSFRRLMMRRVLVNLVLPRFLCSCLETHQLRNRRLFSHRLSSPWLPSCRESRRIRNQDARSAGPTALRQSKRVRLARGLSAVEHQTRRGDCEASRAGPYVVPARTRSDRRLDGACRPSCLAA